MMTLRRWVTCMATRMAIEFLITIDHFSFGDFAADLSALADSIHAAEVLVTDCWDWFGAQSDAKPAAGLGQGHDEVASFGRKLVDQKCSVELKSAESLEKLALAKSLEYLTNAKTPAQPANAKSIEKAAAKAQPLEKLLGGLVLV